MNRTYLLILLIATFCLVLSCKKDKSDSPKFGPTNSVTGTWEMRFGSGMIPLTQYPAGNGNTIKFTDQQYVITLNGQVSESGKYKILSDPGVVDATCLEFPHDRYTQRIEFDHAVSPQKKFFELRGDTLEFVSGCFAYDGGSFVGYLKVH